MSDNPLLRLHQPLPFDAIRPADVEPAIDALLVQARRTLREIAEVPSPSFETVFLRLDRETAPLEEAMSVVEHLESTATSDELRAAHNAVVPKVSEFWSSIPLDAGLYRALRRAAQAPREVPLSPEQARFVTKTLEDFKRHGAELSDEDKARMQRLDSELAVLTTRYNQNVLDATASFELLLTREKELAGLPESLREAARADAEAHGKTGWRITLHAPSVVPALTYLDDASIRERLWRAFNTRATSGEKSNVALMEKILALRAEKAKLLGFADFADLVTADRMAKDGRTVRRFVDELTERTRPAFEREQLELLAFRRELEGPEAPELAPWDVGYYAEKLRKARYDFDEEILRDYFPLEATLDGVLRLGEELFGLRILPEAGLPVWDESVRAFRVLQDDRQLGTFYFDPHPRDTKGGGAWMHGLIPALAGAPGVAVMVTNATPPTPSTPSRLTHRELETLLHEFGHLLHHLVSQVTLRSFSGI